MIAFDVLVAAHIVTGTTGLASVWVPVLTRKGSRAHKLWGRVFVGSMLATGVIAMGISICSLIAPLATHPFSQDTVMIRGLFGWMMLYLGVLTVALTWHGYTAVRDREDRRRYQSWRNIAVQAAMGIAALTCAIHGAFIGQPIMIGVALPGMAAAVLNGFDLVDRAPPPLEWLVQHYRASIGAGISVYTAFLAFGAVNAMPALAFNPVLWAVPTVVGVAYMIRHQLQTTAQRYRMGQGHRMRIGRYLAPLFAEEGAGTGGDVMNASRITAPRQR